ncbi:MAG: hypothetical protein FWD58_06050 [Firmicutes bacterium]|nr:hypothetical protein [Bacillota bacterium]
MLKLVKKTLVGLLCAFMLFAWTACDCAYSLYTRPDKEVTAIELIYYDDLDAKANPLVEYPLDVGKMMLLEELDPAEIESFLDKLCDIGEYAGPAYKQILFSHYGKGVRIIYEDASFTIITLNAEEKDSDCFYVADYDSDGNQTWSESVIIGNNKNKGAFNNLISEYFSAEALVSISE